MILEGFLAVVSDPSFAAYGTYYGLVSLGAVSKASTGFALLAADRIKEVLALVERIALAVTRDSLGQFSACSSISGVYSQLFSLEHLPQIPLHPL